MFSDYRSFGICPCDLAQTGANFVADTVGQNGGVIKGYMHLNAIADATLSNVVFLNDRNQQAGSPYNITLKAGCQLAGVKSFTMGAGQVQVLYFFS